MEPTTVKQLHEHRQPLGKTPISFEEPYLRGPDRDDEISLIDLWLILVRHRRLIAVIVALALAAGAAKALLIPANYQYVTSIQIGQTIQLTDKGLELRPLESADQVLAKLQNGYIPRALNAYRRRHPEDTQNYRITASVPKNSGLVVLTSTGAEDLKPVYAAIHRDVVASVAADQNTQLSNTRQTLNIRLQRAQIDLAQLQNPSALTNGQGDLEARIDDLRAKMAKLLDPKLQRVPRVRLQRQVQEAKDRLAQLKDQEGVLQAGYRHLDDTAALLQGQIKELQSSVQAAARNRTRAAGQVGDGTQAMTLLMLDTELQKDRNLLAGLQERRKIDLPSQREELSKKLDDNRRAQGEAHRQITEAEAQLAGLDAGTAQKEGYYKGQIGVLQKQLADLQVQRQTLIQTKRQQIAELGVELDRLQPTRAIATPDETADQVGPGKVLIVALALVVGVLLAAFAAFAAEFLEKARVAARRLEPA